MKELDKMITDFLDNHTIADLIQTDTPGDDYVI